MKIICKFLTVILLQFFILYVPAQTVSQKPKRIYITLDVSGSMRDNKYVMANYAAQTIAVFHNPGDLVSVYYLGKRHDIGSTNGYKQIQIPFNHHYGQNTYHEISDLKAFLKDYSPNTSYQDWLFIIGDGDWDYDKAHADYDETTSKLADLFAKGQLQVCYLQTGDKLNSSYPFTNFLLNQNSPMIEIKKSDTQAESVLKNCTFFVNKILGFSNSKDPLQQEGKSCVSFCSEFPLDHCLLVYQSYKTVADELEITSVEGKQRSIGHCVKGNPTTKPLVPPGDPVLNGVVWELSCPQTIPANETVKLCFNQDIDVNSLMLYPYVDVMVQVQPLTEGGDPLEQVSDGFFKICDKEDRVVVKLIVTDKHNRKFCPPLMQKMNVKVNGVTAAYSSADTTFQVVVKMPGDTVSFYSTVESPGYFSLPYPLQTVVKDTGVCPPEKIPLITLPVQRFDPVRFNELQSGALFGGHVCDSLLQALTVSGAFDEKALKAPDSWMFESADLSVDGLDITLSQKPKNGLCECAFPDTLYYEVTLRSSKGILHEGKLYEGVVIPIAVPVDKQSWWMRCKVYVWLGIGLFLFLMYLLAMGRKRRFGKDANIEAVQFDMWGAVAAQYSIDLRQPSKGAWLARWLWPSREKCTLSFFNPEVSNIVFIAGKSVNYVIVPTKSITEPVEFSNINVDEESERPKFVKLADNDKIYVKNKTGTAYNGYLQYCVGDCRKNKGNKLLFFILILSVIAAEGFVFWILLKSFILMWL